MATAEPEVVAHEPHAALVSGADGLDDLRMIVAEAPKFLSSSGLLAMETGIAQEAGLSSIAETAGLAGECVEDMSGRPRFYFCRNH
jgi:release factor glutamine methyltransferase